MLCLGQLSPWRFNPSPWPNTTLKSPTISHCTTTITYYILLVAMFSPWILSPLCTVSVTARPFPFGTTDDEDLPTAGAGGGGGSRGRGIASFLQGEDCGQSGCGPMQDDEYDGGQLLPMLADSCKLDGCWQLYQTAQTSLGLGDGFSSSRGSRDESTPSPQHIRDRCIALRTYRKCIENMTRCKGNLNYHTSAQVVQAKMRQSNCSTSGAVFDGGTASAAGSESGGSGRRPQVCSFRGKPIHRHCGLFGDPHLSTFNNQFQTCKVQGAWPLLDNEYVTVQVTNDPVGLWEGTATATSKLTVVVKRHHDCADDRFVTYQAQTDMLPGVFDDGRTEFGPEGAVRITQPSPGHHVEIYLRYIDTTLIIRQIGKFLTFAARMPEQVINERRPIFPVAINELCVQGCPHSERINYKQFLARKHQQVNSKNSLQQQQQQLTSRTAMSRHAAQELCRKAKVVDFYFDSCVFDLMTTGDMNFTLAASQALRDVLQLMPHMARMHKNRTDLLEIDAEYRSSATSLHLLGAHRTETYARLLWTTLCFLALVLSQRSSA